MRQHAFNRGGGFPSHAEQIRRLASYHTLPDQVGKVAAATGAPTLVLSHLTPLSTADELTAEVSRDYRGTLIVGEDLMEIR